MGLIQTWTSYRHDLQDDTTAKQRQMQTSTSYTRGQGTQVRTVKGMTDNETQVKIMGQQRKRK